MRTTKRTLRALCVLLALAFCVGLDAPASLAADNPGAHASYGPPKPPPADWAGALIGVDKQGHYCQQDVIQDTSLCRPLTGGELPGTVDPGSQGTDSTHAEREAHERKALAQWESQQDQSTSLFKQRDAFLKQCLTKGFANGGLITFQECENQGAGKYPNPTPGVSDWVAGKVSQLAADALKEAADDIGASVVWLLHQFADIFNSVSTIQLAQTGIGKVMGLMSVLSVLIATFLLLLQFGKVAISQQGGPLATALTGLAKWAVILAGYVLVTQTALDWSDSLSTWIINFSFEGGGSGTADATKAMQEQLGKLFSALVASGGGAAAGGALVTSGGVLSNAVGVVIVLGILCILVIGALWIEMLIRQAGIMILVASMPVVLAGQVSDATKEWWPKARNALAALILMKPVIVICFAIGFSAMTQGNGIQNVIVGMIIFILAATSWPVLAKFMTFSTNGEGRSAASGMLGAVGSSVSSMFGGYSGALAGAGAVGGGSGFTRALEEDTAATANSGSNTGRGGFWSKVGGSVGMGLQLAALGHNTAAGAAGNAAAHAGLGQPEHGGGNVVIPPRRGRGGEPPAPQAGERDAPPAQPPRQESLPPTRSSPPPQTPPPPNPEGS